jgi:hypothetical protein
MHTEPISKPSFSIPTSDRWTAAQVAPLLLAWRASGLSFVGFCRAHGINAMRLQYWAQRDRVAGRQIIGPSTPITSSPLFSEIRPAVSASSLVLTLPCGVTLAVPVDYDVVRLRVVVESLL